MPTQNSLTKKPETKPAFSAVINSPAFQTAIVNTLKDPKRVNRFTTSIISAVNTTPALKECTPASVITAALLGESLGLSPSPQLGQFYMIPFDNKNLGVKEAVFVLGAKGYKALAIKSGVYTKINAMEVKEGELIKYNPFNDEIELKYTEDENVRASLKTIGYFAMIEMTNGFRKVMYWTKEKMINHADAYSQAFSKNAKGGKYPKVSYADYCEGKYDKKTEWLYSSNWYKDFDAMGIKTMIRRILSQWAILSDEMKQGYIADGAVIRDNNEMEYVDNPSGIEDADFITPNVVYDAPSEETASTTQQNDEFAEIMGG